MLFPLRIQSTSGPGARMCAEEVDNWGKQEAQKCDRRVRENQLTSCSVA